MHNELSDKNKVHNFRAKNLKSKLQVEPKSLEALNLMINVDIAVNWVIGNFDFL